MLGTSKSISGFDPRSVPGCALWLDAADTNSLTLSGSNVTQWSDKSGNGFNANAYTGVAAPVYSQSARTITFNGTNYFYTNYPSNPTNESVFIIFNSASVSAGNLIEGNKPSGGGARQIAFTTSGGNFNANASGVTAGPSISGYLTGVTYIGECFITSGSTQLYINGQNPSSSVSLSFTAGNTTNIGAFTTSQNGTPNYLYSGTISEILIYNTALGTSQRQQVEGYLAHKWGLTGYYNPTTPFSIPGCQLWLDGADPAGTGTPPANGTILSTWADKSGNGRNATPTGTGPTYTANTFNGYSAPVFNGTTMRTPSYLITPDSKLSIFVLCKKTGLRQAGGNSDILSIAAGYQYFDLYIRTSQTNYLDIIYANTSISLTTYAINDGTNLLVSILTNGLSISGYLNGTSVFNTTAGSGGYPLNNLTSQWNISEAQFVGPICEIIIFNSTFTNAQRETIEGYLTRKWGLTTLYPAIPSTHPFSSIRPHLRPFQPTDVPGCLLWLDGADQGSMTLSGSSVTQWRDKSGRGFNVATSSGATAPLYNSSTKELQFVSGNSNSFTIPQAFGDALVGTTFSFFFIGRRTVNTTYVYFLSGATSGGNQNLFIGFLSNKMEIGEYGPYASADIPTFNSPDPMRLYYYDIQSSTTANLIMNGNPLSTTVSGNLFLTSFAQPELGRRYGGAVYHDFNLSEMVVFSPALNTSQRQQVEGYLAHKWGLNTTYGTNTPLLIPGCQLWLDAADSSTITGTTSITAWRDKSGRGNNAVFTGTNPSYVAASNVVITANLNQGFTVPAATIQQTTGSGSIFLVYGDQQTQGSSYAALFSSPLPAQSFCQSLKRPDSYSYQFNNSTSPVLATVVNALNTTNTIIYTMNYTYNSTTGSIRVNGTTCASSFNSSPTPSGALTISSSGWGDGANVRLYEIITFVNVVPLTTVQQQQIEGYLAKKWGLTVSGQFLSTHPFRSIPPASLPFSPRNISGLQLWLDAADTSTLTVSGSNVSSWRDKSGNNNNATQPTLANQPTTGTLLNGLNVLDFTGTQPFFSFPTISFTNITVFTIFRNTTLRAYCSPLFIGPFFFFFTDGAGNNLYGTGRLGVNGEGIISQAAAGITTTNYLLYSLNLTVGATDIVNFYINGANAANFNGAASGGRSYYQVGSTDGVGATTGFTAEILVYNGVLNNSQRQQIEGYLAQKWGLTTSLPATHPYVKLPA